MAGARPAWLSARSGGGPPGFLGTLRQALLALDPDQRWGGLNPATTTEDRNIIYVCDMHYWALQYRYAGR